MDNCRPNWVENVDNCCAVAFEPKLIVPISVLLRFTDEINNVLKELTLVLRVEPNKVEFVSKNVLAVPLNVLNA